MNFDVIIKGGKIITGSDEFVADIGILEGKVVEIGVNLEGDAKEVIDAKGKYVLPRAIDAHTHLDMPFGGTFSSNDFETGTKAAAIGGTTSVIDFAVQPIGDTLAHTAELWKGRADGKAVIDYGIHIAVTDVKNGQLDEIKSMVENGYTSYKVFMVYDNMRVEDDVFISVLETATKEGAIIGVRCENYFIIKKLVAELLEAGKVEPKYHAISRPSICEGEAANRAIVLAEVANSPLMIVHNSCKESVEAIRGGRARGVKVMGETCPQYVLTDYSAYEEPNFGGAKYVMSPPIRPKEHQEYIWEALRDGTLQTVSTDHCPFFMEQKELGKDDFSKIPNGAPDIEARYSLMLTHGPKHGLPLQKVVSLCATNPAKIYGMYSKKGTIAPGSDADIVIWDPEDKRTITVDMLHENVDYIPFEGIEVDGWPCVTLSRGEIIAKDGEYVGADGRGEFLKRDKTTIL